VGPGGMARYAVVGIVTRSLGTEGYFHGKVAQ
jgi:hypothetical protein